MSNPTKTKQYELFFSKSILTLPRELTLTSPTSLIYEVWTKEISGCICEYFANKRFPSLCNNSLQTSRHNLHLICISTPAQVLLAHILWKCLTCSSFSNKGLKWIKVYCVQCLVSLCDRSKRVRYNLAKISSQTVSKNGTCASCSKSKDWKETCRKFYLRYVHVVQLKSCDCIKPSCKLNTMYRSCKFSMLSCRIWKQNAIFLSLRSI